MLEKGQAAQFEIMLATAITETPPGAPIPIIIESVMKAKKRPGGLRFGELFHGILRDTDLAASRESIARLAAIHGKVTGASSEEIEAAVEAVAAALAHPILQQAAAAPRCHREMPLLLPIGDRRSLEGVIDLAFIKNNEWTVVDFKTDAEFSTNNSRYERQVQWYVYGLATLTGLPAKGILLRA